MTGIELDKLLEGVSPDLPSGNDLEYDPALQELRDAVAGQPERRMGESVVPSIEPDWKRALSLAVELLSRSKDLRISTLLCQALLHTEGLPGLAKGLKLTRGFLENFWDSVFPQLDPEDNNDPTARVNAVADLCGGETFVNPLRTTTLISSRVFGPVSLRDIEIAEGKVPPPADTGKQPMDKAAIHAALQDCELEQLQAAVAAVTGALASVKEIERLVTDRVGTEAAPDLRPLTALLSDADATLRPGLAERERALGEAPLLASAAAQETTAETNASQAAPSSPQGVTDIKSRDDVVRLLDRLCDYYARHEPSSPVPLLLRRARHLVTKDFVDIIRDLAPDALTQIEAIRGPDADS